MEVDQGDPLTAIVLAILCNREDSKKITFSRKEYEQVPRGMMLKLSSTGDSVSVELVKR